MEAHAKEELIQTMKIPLSSILECAQCAFFRLFALGGVVVPVVWFFQRELENTCRDQFRGRLRHVFENEHADQVERSLFYFT
jgi:hypothetical protein